MTVLEDARSVVERGWHQGSYTDDEGNFCPLGALSVAMGIGYGDHWVPGASVVAMKLASYLPDVGWNCSWDTCSARGICTHIPHFNDDPGTTKDDVLALFDKAIAAEAEL